MKKEQFFEITEYIKKLIDGSEFEGHVFAVGGSVRDLHMGNEIKDIDLVIDQPEGGIRFAKWCEEQEVCSKVVVYPTYGTAMFKFKKFPFEEIECVMTRGEKYEDPETRNPVTCFAPIEEDAIRRDLTINALYYNITSGDTVDLVGGIQDIQDKIIRTTNHDPDVVFDDDPLRILRVVRFASRYSFPIEEKTEKSMKKFVRRLRIISKERIRDEFMKILCSKDPVYGVNKLNEIGAMKYIVPDFEQAYGMKQNAFHFGDVAEHTLHLLKMDVEHFKTVDPICRLAEFLHDIGKVRTMSVKDGKVHFYDHETVGAYMVRPILEDLKFDNDTINEVTFLVRNHMRTKNFGDWCEKIKPKSRNKLLYICKTPERLERLARVIECDNLSHKQACCIYEQYQGLMVMARDHKYMFGYKLPVNGNDIMKELNIPAGPDIKEILDYLLKQAFSNPEITYDSCIKLAKSWLIQNKKI